MREIDWNAAARYIRKRLDAGLLTPDHIALLVSEFQRAHDLDVDAKPGTFTIEAIERYKALIAPPVLVKVWPLPRLADGREPVITSRFRTRNPDRPRHTGIDLFYRYKDGDPPMRVGDGGRTKTFFIPPGTHAIAAADGTVVRAGKIDTGYRVAIEHADGHVSLYVHLRNALVSVGATVTRGQRLGEVGDNPIDYDAAHLHFGLQLGERYVDPEAWLEGAAFLVHMEHVGENRR